MSNEKQKQEKAVALQYNEEEELPRVTAVGENRIAKKIIALAEQYSIPIYQNDTLAQILTKVDSGSVVPEESIELMADLLAFLYHVDKKAAEKYQKLVNN